MSGACRGGSKLTRAQIIRLEAQQKKKQAEEIARQKAERATMKCKTKQPASKSMSTTATNTKCTKGSKPELKLTKEQQLQMKLDEVNAEITKTSDYINKKYAKQPNKPIRALEQKLCELNTKRDKIQLKLDEEKAVLLEAARQAKAQANAEARQAKAEAKAAAFEQACPEEKLKILESQVKMYSDKIKATDCKIQNINDKMPQTKENRVKLQRVVNALYEKIDQLNEKLMVQQSKWEEISAYIEEAKAAEAKIEKKAAEQRAAEVEAAELDCFLKGEYIANNAEVFDNLKNYDFKTDLPFDEFKQFHDKNIQRYKDYGSISPAPPEETAKHSEGVCEVPKPQILNRIEQQSEKIYKTKTIPPTSPQNEIPVFQFTEPKYQSHEPMPQQKLQDFTYFDVSYLNKFTDPKERFAVYKNIMSGQIPVSQAGVPQFPKPIPPSSIPPAPSKVSCNAKTGVKPKVTQSPSKSCKTGTKLIRLEAHQKKKEIEELAFKIAEIASKKGKAKQPAAKSMSTTTTNTKCTKGSKPELKPTKEQQLQMKLDEVNAEITKTSDYIKKKYAKQPNKPIRALEQKLCELNTKRDKIQLKLDEEKAVLLEAARQAKAQAKAAARQAKAEAKAAAFEQACPEEKLKILENQVKMYSDKIKATDCKIQNINDKMPQTKENRVKLQRVVNALYEKIDELNEKLMVQQSKWEEISAFIEEAEAAAALHAKIEEKAAEQRAADVEAAEMDCFLKGEYIANNAEVFDNLKNYDFRIDLPFDEFKQFHDKNLQLYKDCGAQNF